MMIFGRKKCVMGQPKRGINEVMPHNLFAKRIRKSLYFGFAYDENDQLNHISHPLNELAAELFSEPHKVWSLNRLSTDDARNTTATPCSLIMGLIYLDRLIIIDPSYVRRITPLELFVVSMMISSKFYGGCDDGVSLADWKNNGDMRIERLKELEIEFLSAIEWNIYISNDEFFNKLSEVEKILARREGLKRGWLTYTELIEMLPSFTILKFLLKTITVMSLSYAASVMTIASAFFLASQIPGNALYQKSATNTQSNKITPMVQPANDLRDVNITQGSEDVYIPHETNDMNSCFALNAEAELIKLDQEHREEARRECLRLRQNEITTNSRLTLAIAVPFTEQGSSKIRKSIIPKHNQLQNWLILLENYREDNQSIQKSFMFPGILDISQIMKNCSEDIFSLSVFLANSEMGKQSIGRLPIHVYKPI